MNFMFAQFRKQYDHLLEAKNFNHKMLLKINFSNIVNERCYICLPDW